MILPKNGLRNCIARLVVDVLNTAEKNQTPYVTYRNAARALSAGKRARWDGGSWQRRMGETYCYRRGAMQGREYREALWKCAAVVQS